MAQVTWFKIEISKNGVLEREQGVRVIAQTGRHKVKGVRLKAMDSRQKTQDIRLRTRDKRPKTEDPRND